MREVPISEIKVIKVRIRGNSILQDECEPMSYNEKGTTLPNRIFIFVSMMVVMPHLTPITQ